MNNALGTLFLVGTPIGNLEDMTFRAVRTLSEVDTVYCEDTRRTQILINHYRIALKNPLKSFHDHSDRRLLAGIGVSLSGGSKVAYVTDAGMPVVSDPGFVLVREALKVRAKVEVIPGASAAVSLFSMSALPSPKYFFHGFFPHTKNEVQKVLDQIKTFAVVHLFYEGPSKILKTLDIFNRQMPQAEVVLGRELTKMHEEVLRGTPLVVIQGLLARERKKIRGEIVFAIHYEPDNQPENQPENQTSEPNAKPVFMLTQTQMDEIKRLAFAGISSKDAAKELSKKFGVPRRLIYEYIVKKLT